MAEKETTKIDATGLTRIALSNEVFQAIQTNPMIELSNVDRIQSQYLEKQFPEYDVTGVAGNVVVRYRR